jgi:glycine cleavage system H protein
LLNKSPYQEGWIIQVKPSEPSELDALMSRAAYIEMLKGLQ